jgi:hypothetical protein
MTKVDYLMGESLDVFYWIGFLLADGCFRSSNGNGILEQITVLLANTDKEHLEKLAINLNSKVTIRKNVGFTDSLKAVMQANSKIMVPKICEKFDINFRKTYNPPNFESYNNKFNDEQILSIIVGFVDGDGSIYDNGNNGHSIGIECHISWKNNLEYINNFVHTYFNVSKRTKVGVRARGQCYLKLGKQELLKYIKQFIKINNLPVLDRKWNKIMC